MVLSDWLSCSVTRGSDSMGERREAHINPRASVCRLIRHYQKCTVYQHETQIPQDDLNGHTVSIHASPPGPSRMVSSQRAWVMVPRCSTGSRLILLLLSRTNTIPLAAVVNSDVTKAARLGYTRLCRARKACGSTRGRRRTRHRKGLSARRPSSCGPRVTWYGQSR